MERTRLKALAKVITLSFDVEEYRRELKGYNGNGTLSFDQLDLCLKSALRELDIWNFILKLTEEHEKN